mgnify:FL=1|tara:strand:- start:4338 stop:5399 length:1062 start_codon:yes stop_codon:yes gene_type:complete
MRLKFNDKLITRLLTFFPPVFGIITFTYVVKFSGIESVINRIPLFQGITAWFALILLGFTYTKSRESILGIKMVPILLGIFIFPVVFYVYNGAEFFFTVLFVIIQLCVAITNYTMIIKGNIKSYLILAIINSFILPVTLAANLLVLSIFCTVVFLIMLYVLNSVSGQLNEFSYSNQGLDVIKSMLLQSPFIILPFFDFKIASIIGSERYADYVLLYKYINGVIVLLFSYKQLNLTFSGDLKRKNLIIYQLFFALSVLIFISFFKSWIFFVISIALYSYGINLSSLLVRKSLLDGIGLNKTFIGPICVILYVLIIFNFEELIKNTENTFIILMYAASFITALGFKLFNNKFEHS